MITNKSKQILCYTDDIHVVKRTTSASEFQRLEKEVDQRISSLCFEVFCYFFNILFIVGNPPSV
uniref:Uncharacterized protein n=1 Tax=Megaselia scalaris TaxID=36166 RepID=T1H1G2_MEGSC